MILQIFLTKMAITQPRKVQIPKFWCLKSSTNIWQSCGNIYSIPKINKIELRGENGSKLAKIGQFFALKKLKLNFLKNFPGFYFKSFLCVFLYVSMNFSHWQNLCDTPDLVCSLHRHRGQRRGHVAFVIQSNVMCHDSMNTSITEFFANVSTPCFKLTLEILCLNEKLPENHIYPLLICRFEPEQPGHDSSYSFPAKK